MDKVVAAVEAEGERLRAEFYRPDRPRGRRGSAPIDLEIENRLREKLCALVPSTFAGEESGTTLCDAPTEYVWLVDPQDGTFDFLSGKRGSAISVALLRNCVPVLAVIHSPLSPDRGHDTVAWREGEAAQRNGMVLKNDLSGKKLTAGQIVFATASSALRPDTFSRAFAPARYVAMPSIAYRLARVAAGDGIATLSVHGVNEYDIAAGLALVRAAGGVMLDAEGREVTLSGLCDTRITGCYAGAPEAAQRLAQFDWKALDAETRRPVRTPLGYPRKDDEPRVSRAEGCFLGLLLQEKNKDSEKAILLARHLAAERFLDVDKLRAIYLQLGFSKAEKPGAALAPIGIWAAGDPERAARVAREACALFDADARALESAAAYCAAIAATIAGAPLADLPQDPAWAGALRGAAGGRAAFPPQAVLDVLASRPDRPFELWPDDFLELAEALVQ